MKQNQIAPAFPPPRETATAGCAPRAPCALPRHRPLHLRGGDPRHWRGRVMQGLNAPPPGRQGYLNCLVC